MADVAEKRILEQKADIHELKLMLEALLDLLAEEGIVARRDFEEKLQELVKK